MATGSPQLLRGGKFLNTPELWSVLFFTRKKRFIDLLLGKQHVTHDMKYSHPPLLQWIDNYLASPDQTLNQALWGQLRPKFPLCWLEMAGKSTLLLVNMKELEVLGIAPGLKKTGMNSDVSREMSVARTMNEEHSPSLRGMSAFLAAAILWPQNAS